MLRAALAYFRPAPAIARLTDTSRIARLYVRWRWSVFLSVTIGYGVYYLARRGLSVTKESIIATDLLSAAQLGAIDSAFLLTYAIGKTTNGFLADRINPRPFFATALVLSAAANIAFGMSSSFPIMIALWALNGWVQSVGVPVSGVVMSSWFGTREIGTRYSIWSIAHHLGEGLTFLVTARIVVIASHSSSEPWRAAFIVSGALALVAAIVLYRTLADRPESLGLPPIHEHRNEALKSITAGDDGASVWSLQLVVLRNPWVWVCGLASAMMYVSRYAMNDWAVFYMQTEKGYDLETASGIAALFPMVGIPGTLIAGPLSDRLFGARRTPVTLGYGIMLAASLAVFYLWPPGHRWVEIVSVSIAGFAIGGLLAFLGGLIAMDLSPKRSAGAALGLVGGLSYAGAGVQALVSGFLIEADHRVVAGVHKYDFTQAKVVWIAAPIVSLLLAAFLWIPERRMRSRLRTP